ncbi:MAG: binding-protein-dependent transport system inner rane component [Acidimicrobiaceae bacterium]|nr:binding-protein-dependent transport system inner rane component [Acidimicrobiaceae bacterium]
MAPAAVVLLVLVGWPLVRLVENSLYSGGLLLGGRHFSGLSNYSAALRSGDIRAASGRTGLYALLVLPTEIVLGFAMALLFRAVGERSRLLRTLFLYPLLIAPLVAGLLWQYLLAANLGILNQLLYQVGLIHSPSSILWLSNPSIALISVAIPDIWLTTSFVALVLFAGLQALPADVYEAARIDGANSWQAFWRITLPLLRPVLAVVVVIRLVDAVQAFAVILIETNGGPQSASTTLSLDIYNTMITYGNTGLASAASVLFMVAMMVVAAIALRTIWRPGAVTR